MERIMKAKTQCSFLGILWLFILCLTPSAYSEALSHDDSKTFLQEEAEWRKKRDKEMRAPTSWLNIAGLYWLEEGENAFGTSGKNPIKLPEGSAPQVAGRFYLDNGTVSVIAEQGIPLKVDGKTIHRFELKADDTGKPDIVELNNLRMWVIQRFDMYAIRLRDLDHLPYKNYTGLDFFTPNEKYRVQAEFQAFAKPKKLEVGTAVGKNTVMDTPGYVTFKIDGTLYRLEAFSADPQTLFFIFGDETNGKETYEASRFMNARILENGKVDLNFNRAYNPPCAYTPFATCPLPPPQNQLKIRILAGEKKYPGSHH
jgi:uncharacterized protein (DUF1684 family)